MSTLPLTHDLLDQRIHLVCGKGGVGRTTVASAMARAVAKTGKRVLLCEVGDPDGGPSAIGQLFGKPGLTPDPEPLGPEGLHGCIVWASRGHELFAQSVLPAGPVIRTALRSKTLRKFVTAVPSLYELGLFYHLLCLLKEENKQGEPRYEVIVADMPATGQTLALTSLPDILLDALPDGPIPRYMREGQSYLNDPEKCHAWIVTLPEPLPVTEALELREGLDRTKVATGAFVLNQVPEAPLTPSETKALYPLIEKHPWHGRRTLARMEATDQARAQLDQANLPVIECPLLAQTGEPPPIDAQLSQRWQAS